MDPLFVVGLCFDLLFQCDAGVRKLLRLLSESGSIALHDRTECSGIRWRETCLCIGERTRQRLRAELRGLGLAVEQVPGDERDQEEVQD